MISQNKITEIVEKITSGYQPVKIFIFGSYAKGTSHKWSDIDVAIVTNKLKRNYEKNRSVLRRIGLDVDLRIEPHGFTAEDFENLADPLVYEIRKTGIRVI